MLGLGEVSERLIELVSKTSVPSGTAGSNPALSVTKTEYRSQKPEARRKKARGGMRTRMAHSAIRGCDTEGAANDPQDREANPALSVTERTQNIELSLPR
jgi:hypothetical protein